MADLIKKRESNLLPVLIIFIGIIVGYIYYSQMISPQEEPTLAPAEKNGLSIFRNIKFNFNIFSTTAFTNLKIFGESPVDSGQIGKENLFAPF